MRRIDGFIAAAVLWALLLPGQAEPQTPIAIPTPVEGDPGLAGAPAPGPMTAPPGPSGGLMTPMPGPAPGVGPAPGTFAPMPGSPGGWSVPAPSLPGGPGAAPTGPYTWDPYSSAGPPAQPLLQQDPTLPSSIFDLSSPADLAKFEQAARLDYDWLARLKGDGLGVNEIHTDATFAFPLFYNRFSPLYVTPGFDLWLWDGPDVGMAPGLPPQTFGGWLDAAWRPRFGDSPLSGDLSMRVGVYSDFEKVSTKSIRLQGAGFAMLQLSPAFQLKFGVMYINRARIKLLPAGGIIWTPNADDRFEILFPNPKLAHRFATVGMCDWWYFVRGEYGGDSWTIDGERTDYNDIRIAGGLEFVRQTGVRGTIEVGLSTDREIFFSEHPTSTIYPDPTVFVGGHLVF